MGAMPVLEDAPKVGGNYTAIDNGDNTFTICDIPIFARVPAGAKRNEREVGGNWMRLALQKNQLRESEGHLPPVHVYHSDDVTVKPEFAGKFRLKRVGTITYEGEQVPALFADIIDIPSEQFSRIRKGTLPYRSVEVHSWNEPEIDSLALMPSEVPFFRMAMTTVGTIIKRDALTVPSYKGAKTPAHRFRTVDAGACILFRFKGEQFMNATKPARIPDKGAITTPKDGTPAQTSGTTTNSKDVNEVLDGGAGFAVEGTVPGGSDDAEVHMADEDQGNGAIMAVLKEILALLKGGGGPAEGGAPPQGEMPAPDPQEEDLAPVSGMRAGEAPARPSSTGNRSVEKIVLRAVGPTLARVKHLEGRIAAKDRSERIAMRLGEVSNELSEFNVDDETREYFRKCAEVGDDFLKEAVENFRRNAIPDPPADQDEFEHLLVSGGGGVSDSVNTFSAKHPGPKNAEWVRFQAKTHADWVKQSGSDVTLDQWLETNWRAETGGL